MRSKSEPIILSRPRVDITFYFVSLICVSIDQLRETDQDAMKQYTAGTPGKNLRQRKQGIHAEILEVGC